MATTDSNGILFYEETDAVSPLHTLLNGGQQSVSDAFTAFSNGSGGEIVIHYVANTAARATLATAYSPTASKPLFVYRGDATAGFEVEVTENGTGWSNLGGGSIRAVLTRTTALSIAAAVITTVEYSSTELVGCTYSAGVVTVPSAGLYEVMFSFDWAPNATGGRVATVTLNGTATNILGDDMQAPGARIAPMKGARLVRLAAGNTLQLRVVHSGSTNLGPDYTNQPLTFSVRKVAD